METYKVVNSEGKQLSANFSYARAQKALEIIKAKSNKPWSISTTYSDWTWQRNQLTGDGNWLPEGR